jgi:hypothetical protein
VKSLLGFFSSTTTYEPGKKLNPRALKKGDTMKSVLLSALLMSGFAFAGTHMSHNYSQVLEGIALDNACVTDDTVQTIEPVRVCATELRSRVVRGGGGDSYSDYTEWYCPRYKRDHIVRSRSFDRTVCTDLRRIAQGDMENMKCVRYGKKADFLPDVIKIQVWEDWGDHSTWPGKTRSFRFPHCE